MDGLHRHFAHLKSGDLAKDKNLLLTTILADAINLGLTKMAESCPDTTYAKLAWLQAWHIRDETYSTALAELVNAQFRHPLAEHWGAGTTSSSDGQNFRTGSKAEGTGHINPKYGSTQGRTFYTHISDQYAPFHTKVVNFGVRELGRIERTLFILDWLQSVELRRRVHAGLNKGEARNALARTVFFNRLGEIRDRSFEQQRYRASGLNLVTAAIVLWNTVYLERAANVLCGHGQTVDDALLQ
jgi:TnpA family transposase